MILSLFLPSLNVSNYHIADSIMKKILKETPISINGKDCLELLVHDDCILASSPCDLCWYMDSHPDPELLVSCCDVHGCTQDINSYFVVI